MHSPDGDGNKKYQLLLHKTVKKLTRYTLSFQTGFNSIPSRALHTQTYLRLLECWICQSVLQDMLFNKTGSLD